MTRILFVGQKPETVDFSDPALPPGFDAEKINAGIAVGVQHSEGRGWPANTGTEVKRIGDAVTGVYALPPDHHMRVNLVYGFNLGIASGSRSYSDDYKGPMAGPAQPQ